MAETPVCGKCIITKELTQLIEAYKDFQGFLDHKSLNLISDHARGYCHGQLAVADDVIRDVTRMIPHLQAEAKLRARSDKGL